MGGRGLTKVTTTYKETRLKAELRFTTRKDPKLRAVATFQQVTEGKVRRSMLKDAKKYTTELKLDLKLDGDPEIPFNSTEGDTYTSTGLDGTRRVLTKHVRTFRIRRSKRASGKGRL